MTYKEMKLISHSLEAGRAKINGPLLVRAALLCQNVVEGMGSEHTCTRKEVGLRGHVQEVTVKATPMLIGPHS